VLWSVFEHQNGPGNGAVLILSRPDPRLYRNVAIKVLPQHLALNADLSKRLQRTK